MTSGRKRYWLKIPALVILACFASALAVYARGYMTAGFRTKKSRPATIVVLPPHAEFIKEKVIMTDQMVSEAAALEAEAARSIKAQLETRGYKVRILAPQALDKNPNLRALVKKLNDRYNEEWSRMVQRPRKVRERRYIVGADVVRLCSFLKVDGVAVVRIQAVGVSKGKATMRWVAGSSAPHSYARMDVGILEGRQGGVEGYFFGLENTSLSQMTKKPAVVMGQVAENSLRKYPASTEVEEVSETDAAAVTDDRDGGDNEDAVKDFEALLGQKQGASR